MSTDAAVEMPNEAVPVSDSPVKKVADVQKVDDEPVKETNGTHENGCSDESLKRKSVPKDDVANGDSDATPAKILKSDGGGDNNSEAAGESVVTKEDVQVDSSEEKKTEAPVEVPAKEEEAKAVVEEKTAPEVSKEADEKADVADDKKE
ncbi:unnamed protein product [Notodromas monacha]|uniref:Uncharacterized protein n=1 Tax=Notodromas monacha TaxID=399045 RepID=A0A7R9BKR7_9CRUS|nr:unnamed protein product [Notodromas monacha]CAG0915784.1 unnamed protein product [Notodromas monacha]